MNGSLHHLFEMAAARDWYSSPGSFLYDHRQASAADYESTFGSDPSANFTLPSSMVTPSIHPAFPTDPYHSMSIMNAVMSPPMPPLPSLESPTGNHYGNAAIPSPFSPTWSHSAGNNPQYDNYFLHAKDEQLRRMQSSNSQRCAVSDYSSFLSPGHSSTSFAVPAWNSGLPAVTNGQYSPYYHTASLNYQTGDGFGAYRSQPSHYGANQNFETDLTPIERLTSLTSEHATALPASQHSIQKHHENNRSSTRKIECMTPAQKQLMPTEEMRGRYFMTKDAVSLAEKLQIDVWNHDVISHAYPGTGQVPEWDYRCAMSASNHHSLTSQSSASSSAGLGDTQDHSTSSSRWNAIYAPGSSSVLPVISTSAYSSSSCSDLQMSGGQQLPAIQSLTSSLRRTSTEDRSCTVADYGRGIETSRKSCTAVYKPVSRPWSQTTQPSTTTCFTSPVITSSILNRSVATESHSCSEQAQSCVHREKMNASQYSENVAETSEFKTKADCETTPVLQEKLMAIINREACAAQGESKTVDMEQKNEDETSVVNSSEIFAVVVSDKSLIVEPVCSITVAKNPESEAKSYPAHRTSVDSNLGTTVVSSPDCQQYEQILNGLLSATVNNGSDGPDSKQQTSAEMSKTSPKSASQALTAANGARNVVSKASRLSHILQAISNRKSQLQQQQQQLGEPCTSEQQLKSGESETHHSNPLPVNPPIPAVSDTTPSVQPLHPRSVLRTQRAQSLTTSDGIFLLPPEAVSSTRRQPASRLSRSISTDERHLARIAKNIINNAQAVTASQELQKNHRVEILSQSDMEVFRHPHSARILSRSVSADGGSATSALKGQTSKTADDIVVCDLTDDTEDEDLAHPQPGTVSTTGQESYQRNSERPTKLHHSSSNGSIQLPSVYSSDMDERLMESGGVRFTPPHGVVQRPSGANQTSFRICSEYLMRAGLMKNRAQLISVKRLRPQLQKSTPGACFAGTESVLKNTPVAMRGRPKGFGNIPGTRMRSLLPRSHSFTMPLRNVHFVHSEGKASRTAEQPEASSGIDVVKSIIEREFQQSRSVNSAAHSADVIDVDSDLTEEDTAVVDTNCVETDVEKSAEIGEENTSCAPAESAVGIGNEASLLLLKMKQQAFKTPDQSLQESVSKTRITVSANKIGSSAYGNSAAGSSAAVHAPHSIARLLSLTDTRAIAARRAPFHRIRPSFGIGNQLRLPGVPHKFTLPPPLHRSATTSRLPGLRGASIANQNIPYQQQWTRGMTVKKQLILSDLYALKKASSCVIDLTDDDDDREPANCEEAFARLRKKSGFRRPYHRTMGRRASLADGSCCDVRRRCVPVKESVRYAIDRSLPFYRYFVQFLLKQFRFNSAGMPARIIPELEAVLQAAESAAAAAVPDSQTSSRSRSLSSDSSVSSDEEDEEMDWSKLIEEKRLSRQRSAAAREEIRSCAVLLENIEPDNLKLDAESAKKSEGSYPGLEMICGKIADLIKSKVTSDSCDGQSTVNSRQSTMELNGSDSEANLSSNVDHTNAVGNAKPLWPLFLAAKNREVPKAAEPADQMSGIADEQCMKTKEKRKRSSADGKTKHRKSRSIALKSFCRPLSIVVERLSDERIEQLSSDLRTSYPPDDSPDPEKPHIVIKISANVAQLCVAQLQETLQDPSAIGKLSARPGPASSKQKRLSLQSKNRIEVASSEQLNLPSTLNPPGKDRQSSRPGPASSKRKTRGQHSKNEIKVASVEQPAFPVIEMFSAFSPPVELEQNLPATAETNVAPTEDAASAAVEPVQTSGVVSGSVPIIPLPSPVPSPERQLRAYRCIRPTSSVRTVPRAPKKYRVNSKLDSSLPSTSDAPSPSVILATVTAVNSDVVFNEPEKQQDVQSTSTTMKFETDAERVPEPSVFMPCVTDASDACLAADLDVNPSVVIRISKKRKDPPMDAACEIVDSSTKRSKKSKKLDIVTVAAADQPLVIAAEPTTCAVVASTDSTEPSLKKPKKIKKMKHLGLMPALAVAVPDEPKPSAEKPTTVAQEVVSDSAVPDTKMVNNFSVASSSTVLPKYGTKESAATAAEVGLKSSIEKPKKAKKLKNVNQTLPDQLVSTVEVSVIKADEVASDNVESTLNESEIVRKLEHATMVVSDQPKCDADETTTSHIVEPNTMKKPKKSKKLKNSSVVVLHHPRSTSEEPMAVTVVTLDSLEPSLKKPKKTKKSKNSILPMSDQPKSTTEEPVIATGAAADCSEPTAKKPKKTKKLKNSSLPVSEQHSTAPVAVAEVEPNAKKRKKTKNASVTVSDQPKPSVGKPASASKLKNTSTKKNKIVQKNAILNYFKPIGSLGGGKNSSIPEVPVADSPVSVASSTATVSYPPSPVCLDSAVASLDIPDNPLELTVLTADEIPDNPLELTVLTADDVFKALQIGLNDYALDGNPAPSRKSDVVSVSISDKQINENGFEATSLQNAGSSDSGVISQSLPSSADDGLASGEESEGTVDYEDDKAEPSFPVPVESSAPQTVWSELTCEDEQDTCKLNRTSETVKFGSLEPLTYDDCQSASSSQEKMFDDNSQPGFTVGETSCAVNVEALLSTISSNVDDSIKPSVTPNYSCVRTECHTETLPTELSLFALEATLQDIDWSRNVSASAAVAAVDATNDDDSDDDATIASWEDLLNHEDSRSVEDEAGDLSSTDVTDSVNVANSDRDIVPLSEFSSGITSNGYSGGVSWQWMEQNNAMYSGNSDTARTWGNCGGYFPDSYPCASTQACTYFPPTSSSDFHQANPLETRVTPELESKTDCAGFCNINNRHNPRDWFTSSDNLPSNFYDAPDTGSNFNFSMPVSSDGPAYSQYVPPVSTSCYMPQSLDAAQHLSHTDPFTSSAAEPPNRNATDQLTGSDRTESVENGAAGSNFSSWIAAAMEFP